MVSFACPSYKRPKVETLNYIPFVRVYVDGKEYDAYKEQNPGADIVRCEDGVQGNLCRVRNYIIRQELGRGADAVAIVDDDMEGLYLWQKNGGVAMAKIKLPTKDLQAFFEKYSRICKDLGFFFWGANCNMDSLSYRENSPFSFSAYIGGPLQVFVQGNDCYYDERLPLKEDYDMTLQQCNKHRGCLRLNFLTYNVRQSEQAGGCATYRNMAREREQFLLLQRKWGSGIVREDRSNKGKTKKVKRFDYNPIIKVPIKGI